MREIRDPIHGFIERTEEEEQIIDTRVFQRLRRISQLAMAYLVYPGALHTRFEHSLGVMHIAGRLADKLLEDEKQRRLVRLAALLHDVGHGPFSHVSEEILERYFDKEEYGITGKIHEIIGCEIILKNEELATILSKNDRNEIVNILNGESCDPIAGNIISGPLDADKQDYLLRDSYFCGVKYGVYDIERLINTLEIYKKDEDKDTLAVSSDGMYALEQYIIAKYHMTTQVYFHKVRLVSDAMIVRAIELGLDVDKLDWLRELYSFERTEKFIKNYTKWDDNRLISSLIYQTKEKSGYATEIFKRLQNRELFKKVYSNSLNIIKDPTLRFKSSNNDKKVLKEMENHIAEEISSKLNNEKIDPNLIIIKVLKINSVRQQSRDNEGPIMIIKNQDDNSFERESTLFRSINEKEYDHLIEVYAPISYSDDKEKRKKIKTCAFLIDDYFSSIKGDVHVTR